MDSKIKMIPPWFERTPDVRRFPPLVGEVRADVCIVGGGIVGVIAAWQLVQAGASVVLLEKHHLASGDTGYTTAFITRVPDTSVVKLRDRYGEQVLRRVMAASTDAERYLLSIIRDEMLACDFRECASYAGSYTPNNPKLQQEWRAIETVDAGTSLVGSSSAKIIPFAEAIQCKREARFDARKFIFALFERPTAKKISVYEESEAMQIEVGSDVTLRTNGGVVRASRVILASSKPVTIMPELLSLVRPAVTHAIAVRYDDGVPFSDDLFWDMDDPYQYYRRLDDHTAILGGADRWLDDPKPADRPYELLASFLRQVFPGPFRITHAWSGSLFHTTDGLPYAASHPRYGGKVQFSAGLAGNGMVMGAMVGRLLADRALGRVNEHASLFELSRTHATLPPSIPPTIRSDSPIPIQKQSSLQKIVKTLLPIVYTLLAVVPGYIFFHNRHGLSFLEGVDLKTGSVLLFPLAGLYAFFLVWGQVMLGSNMRWLRRISPRFEMCHRRQGVFTLLFALLHPAMIFFGYGAARYLHFQYVSPSLILFVWLGYFQLTLMLTTVTTALLRKKFAWLRTHWRAIHLLNYVVFVSVWIHSWFLGSDVRSSGLKYLWLFFAMTVMVSAFARFFGRKRSVPVVVPEVY